MNMETVLFSLIISLFLIHEMDAVHTKEWKMFIVLKDLRSSIAYKAFCILHLPIYFLFIYMMITNENKFLYFLFSDVFLIVHTLLHFKFRNAKNNGYNSKYSNFIIYFLGLLSLLHLVLYL